MEKGTRKAFLQEFQKLVGLKSGDLIRKWYNSNVANLGTGKWAWCCATVVYCAKLSKIEVGQTASCSAMFKWFNERGKFINRKSGYKPLPGDIILFDFIKNDGMAASHIGIVEKAENGYIHTIEGNSGNVEDGECKRNTYKNNYDCIVGYLIPEFKTEQTPKKIATLTKKSFLRSKAYIDETVKIIETLKKGDKVEILLDDKYGWSYVKHKDNCGWVQNTRLDSEKLSKYPVATIVGNCVRIRKKPNGQILGSLNYGEKLRAYYIVENGKNKGWVAVQNPKNKRTAFVSSTWVHFSPL